MQVGVSGKLSFRKRIRRAVCADCSLRDCSLRGNASNATVTTAFPRGINAEGGTMYVWCRAATHSAGGRGRDIDLESMPPPPPPPLLPPPSPPPPPHHTRRKHSHRRRHDHRDHRSACTAAAATTRADVAPSRSARLVRTINIIAVVYCATTNVFCWPHRSWAEICRNTLFSGSRLLLFIFYNLYVVNRLDITEIH